ncbi:hypothetical protein [Amycolatopsis sp. NPDC051716]|uniref:hypothetical protein n=1 Tax=Amycolatopsis sp. NPDC051716 TaxID=3155804 RepID=UPI003432B161
MRAVRADRRSRTWGSAATCPAVGDLGALLELPAVESVHWSAGRPAEVRRQP